MDSRRGVCIWAECTVLFYPAVLKYGMVKGYPTSSRIGTIYVYKHLVLTRFQNITATCDDALVVDPLPYGMILKSRWHLG
jgi:hypothetical protein